MPSGAPLASISTDPQKHCPVYVFMMSISFNWIETIRRPAAGETPRRRMRQLLSCELRLNSREPGFIDAVQRFARGLFLAAGGRVGPAPGHRGNSIALAGHLD